MSTIVLLSRAGVGKSGAGSRLIARTLEGMGATVLINPAERPRDHVIVSYGVRVTGTRVPVLNANSGSVDKLQELTMLRDAGVSVPTFYTTAADASEAANRGVLLFGRKLNHTQGKDIMPVFQPEEVPWRIAAGAQYFTEFVPIAREFRTWAYRRRHIATYEKTMARPNEFRRIGHSAHNGFGFYLVRSEDVPREAVRQAAMAVDVRGLDYGAVDIIQSKTGEFYVLEVNTAPGIEGSERFVLRSWCQHIYRWSLNPTKKRTVDWAQEEVAA